MNKEKQTKLHEMEPKFHYDRLTDEDRVNLRDTYCSAVGMPQATFYYKLANNKFRPLERKEFDKLIKEYIM